MSEELSSNEAAAAATPSQTASPQAGAGAPAAAVADVHAFISYLKQFVPVLLDANSSSATEFEKCLCEKPSIEVIKKFLSEAQVRTLIIQKFIIKGASRWIIEAGFLYQNINLFLDEEEGEQVGGDEVTPVTYLVSTEVHYTNPKCLRQVTMSSYTFKILFVFTQQTRVAFKVFK